jgi:hypothetical protein
MRCHFASSGQVLVRSCVSVFAVTTPRVSSCVDHGALADAVSGGHRLEDGCGDRLLEILAGA